MNHKVSLHLVPRVFSVVGALETERPWERGCLALLVPSSIRALDFQYFLLSVSSVDRKVSLQMLPEKHC